MGKEGNKEKEKKKSKDRDPKWSFWVRGPNFFFIVYVFAKSSRSDDHNTAHGPMC